MPKVTPVRKLFGAEGEVEEIIAALFVLQENNLFPENYVYRLSESIPD